jgi:hypothetical protein
LRATGIARIARIAAARRTIVAQLKKRPRNGHFFAAQKIVCARARRPLTAFPAVPARRKIAARSARGAMKKKLRKSLAEASPRRSRERESRESMPTDSQNGLSISLRKPLDKVADVVAAPPIHVPRGIARPDSWRADDVTVHREVGAAMPRDDRTPAVKCRAWP